MKTLQRWAAALSLLAISGYLTWIIDDTTESTKMQMLFVFGYFLLMIMLVYLGVKRYDQSQEKRVFGAGRQCQLNGKQMAAMMLVLGVVCCGYGTRFFERNEELFMSAEESVITVVNMGKDPNGKASEVWFRVKSDGKAVSSELLLENSDNNGWFVKDGYIVSTQEGDTLTIKWSEPTEIKLEFQSHPYTGNVGLTWDGESRNMGLFSENSKNVAVGTLRTRETEYKIVHVMIYIFCWVCIWGGIAAFLRSYAEIRWQLIFYLCWLFTAGVALKEDRLPIEYGAILAASLLTVLFWRRVYTAGKLAKYLKGAGPATIMGISTYFAFALAGNGLFLTESRVNINANSVQYFFMLIGVGYPLVCLLITAFEWAQSKTERLVPVEDKKRILRARVICLLLVFGIETLISLGFYPANMSPDGVDHWLQAKEYYSVYDSHPPFFVLLVRCLSWLIDSPYSFILFQITMYSVILSKVSEILYRKGVGLRHIVVLCACSACLPRNYMSLTQVSKNPLFALVNLWILILLMEIVVQGIKGRTSVMWICEGICALTTLYLVRYNTVFAYCAAILFLIVLSFCYVRIRWGIYVTIVGSVILIAFIQGPIYNSIDIIHVESRSVYGPLMTPLASAKVNDVELPEDIKRDMETILPLEEWENRYNPFNRDTFTWKKPMPDYSGISLPKALKNYLRVLAIHPDIVIKDRLDGCESLWNIFQSSASKAYNSRVIIGVFETMPLEYLPEELRMEKPNANGLYFKPNAISNIAVKLYELTTENAIIDSLTWRSGIYIVVLFVMVIYLFAKQKTIYIWTIVPTVVSMCTLFLVFGWQLFIYQYFFPMAITWFVILVLFLPDVANKRGNKDENTHHYSSLQRG